VDLRRDVRQHFQQSRAAQRAVQAHSRRPGRDQVEHRDVLGDDLAAVEHQCGYVTFGVDGVEVRAGLGQLGLEVDTFQFEVEAAFQQRNVVREAAGAG